jgi:hypothetical protein
MLGDTLMTNSTTRLAYKTSPYRFRLVGFIYSSRFSGYLADAWARGLAKLTTRYILCDLSSSLARGLDATRHSACFQR